VPISIAGAFFLRFLASSGLFSSGCGHHRFKVRCDKDVVDRKLVKEDESSPDEEAEEKAVEEEKGAGDAEEVAPDAAE